MTELAYRSGRSQEADIRKHLTACNDQFMPPLASRVSIPEYARRLASNATCFEAWSGNELVGLVAAYCNAPDRFEAFVTNVSVLPSWTGQGIASRLMRDCIGHIDEKGFERIRLEVDGNAAEAIRIYRAVGFKAEEAQGSKFSMYLELNGKSENE